jgi:hypothetical protein
MELMQNIAAQLAELAKQHRLADEYIKGTYGDIDGGKFKACSIGCAINDLNKINGTEINTSSHAELAAALGIPEWITKVADTIFENLPAPLHTEWSERWLAAVAEKQGADFSLVLPRFLLRMLDELPEQDRQDVVSAISGVREVLQNWADTGAVDMPAAEAARAAAEAAWAAWAAEAAEAALAAAWAAWAARAAAWAAEAAEAARAAAWAAWAARAAARAAWAAAWEQTANDLIDLILEAQ